MRKFLPFFFLILFFSCQNETSVSQTSISGYFKIKGQTMGTTYHITYEDSLGRNFKPEVDSILVEINQGVSTYIPDSKISLSNQNKQSKFNGNTLFEDHFLTNLLHSGYVFKMTKGYFDPTVMPLVNYWGFGYTEKKSITEIDSVKVDSLKKLVGFEKVSINCESDDKGVKCSFVKQNPKTQLDFSAIAKGYAVDVIAIHFEEKGIKNYLVEIGEEMRRKGKTPKEKIWQTAINTPKISAGLNEYQAIVQLNNKAIATSGNYRNFHKVDDEWYGHEINPKTGFPEKSNLLSVSVLTDDCMSADAYATAMMVMGLEKSKALAERLDNLDAFLIFANERGELETFYTKGFEGNVLK